MNKTFSRRNFIKLATAVTASSLCRPLFAYSQSLPQFESRAIMDEGLNWVTNESANKLLSRIKKAGFNVFIPCVWHGRGTIWPSSLAPWDSRSARVAGFDPLDNLIKLAADYEIEVHPWFTVVLRQREFLSQYYDSGTPEKAFDVHDLNFQEFISSLVAEVVLRYPVQGVNLDYLRTMGCCRSLSCIDEYKQVTGRRLLSDWNIRKIPGVDSSALISWQESTIRKILTLVFKKVRAIRRDVLISIDAVPYYGGIKYEGQQSLKWADAGLADVVYSMDYRLNPDYATLRNLQSSMKRPEAIVPIIGNYDVNSDGNVIPRSGATVTELFTKARSISRQNGVSVYLYSMLSDEQINVLSSTVFKIPATPYWVRA